MNKNLERDFQRAVIKLKHKERERFFQRLGIFFRHHYWNVRNSNVLHYTGLILLVVTLLILQSNTNLIVHPINNFITQQKYRPAPPTAPSPWPWKGHATLHPVIAGITPEIEKSIPSVAQYIAKQEPDPFLRVKALHDYVISRVTYDLDVLETGERPSQDAQTVFKTHKAVCEGYANLFKELGKAIQIETVFVGGKIRRDLAPIDLIPASFRLLNSNYDWTLHAWNAVKVAGNWYLVDTTWDDSDDDKAPTSYLADYLMPTPDAMIRSHLPELSVWQLLTYPKNDAAFEKQPLLTPRFFTENFEIVSPVEYPATVQKDALIRIKHAANDDTKVLAVFDQNKEAGVFSSLLELNASTQTSDRNSDQCQSRRESPTMLQISCQFPQRGNYQVYLFKLDGDQAKAKENVSPIGQLRFNVL